MSDTVQCLFCSSSETATHFQEFCFICEQAGRLLGEACMPPAAGSKGSGAGGVGASWRSSGELCGRRAGRAVQGNLPSCAGKRDSELWELGLERSRRGASGEAAESATPL